MRSGLTQRIATGIPSIGSLLPLICGSTVCLGSSLGYKSVPECCEASAKWISACAQIAVARGAPQQFCQDLLSSCPPRLQLAARVPARRRRGAVGLGSSHKIPCHTHTFCRFAVFRNAHPTTSPPRATVRSECFIGEETQTKPTTNIKNGATRQPSHAKGAEGTRFGECRPPRNNHHHIIITCHEIVAPTFASRRGLQDNPCTIPRRCMRRGFGSRCHR